VVTTVLSKETIRDKHMASTLQASTNGGIFLS